MTPEANLLVNRFETAIFSGTNRIRYCGYLLACVLAVTELWPGIRHSAATEVRIEPDGNEPIQVQVDGEVAGALPIVVSVCPMTLSLLIPPRYGHPE